MKSKIVWKDANRTDGVVAFGYFYGTGISPVHFAVREINNSFCAFQEFTTLMPRYIGSFNTVEAAKGYIETEFLQELHEKIWGAKEKNVERKLQALDMIKSSLFEEKARAGITWKHCKSCRHVFTDLCRLFDKLLSRNFNYGGPDWERLDICREITGDKND